MTLEEAHKLQRKELLSLRAENARLKKQAAGVLTIEEKEKLERHIRHLEQIIKTNSSQYELARKSWKLTIDHCHDLEIEVIDLIERLHSFDINQQIEESILSTSYIYSSYEVLSVCYTLDENNNPALIYRVGLKTKARPGQEPEISEMISLIVRDTNPF